VASRSDGDDLRGPEAVLRAAVITITMARDEPVALHNGGTADHVFGHVASVREMAQSSVNGSTPREDTALLAHTEGVECATGDSHDLVTAHLDEKNR
jgi:hypothetical protein